jgi:phage terminase large subunit
VIGIGAGVVDRLKECSELTGTQIIGVNSSIRLDDGRNYNLRARMWRDARSPAASRARTAPTRSFSPSPNR